MTPDMIDAMIDAGLTREQMAALIKHELAKQEAMGPRSVPAALRIEGLTRDGFICRYCGSVESLHCDHVIPYSRGGATVAENLVASCKSCNSSKKDRTVAEWRGK